MDNEPQSTVEQGSEIDFDKLPKQEHNWVKRGWDGNGKLIKVNCEGAGHTFHEHFLYKPE